MLHTRGILNATNIRLSDTELRPQRNLVVAFLAVVVGVAGLVNAAALRSPPEPIA
jgi:hypothetical protein